MTTTTRTRNRGRVLLGHTGESDDWQELQAYLVKAGRNVVLFDATMRADRTGLQGELPGRLDEFELAIVMVSKPVGRLDGVSVRSLVHLTGLLQGAIGYDRVLVLTDREVEPFVHGLGVAEFAYETGDIRARFPQVSSLLGSSEEVGEVKGAPFGTTTARAPSPLAPWLDRFGLEGAPVAPEIWMVLGVIAVLAALAGVIGYQVFSDPVLDTAGVEIEELPPADDVDTDEATVDDEVAAPSTSVSPGLGSAPADGSGPPVGLGVDDGRFDGLPATCVLSTASGEIIGREIDCEGTGGLRVEGFLGPWHSEISEISMDSGVVGEVEIEPRPGATSATRVQLQPVARQSLEPYDSLFGVQRMRFEFSANNQRVVLHQQAGRGGAELTLTFSLDL